MSSKKLQSEVKKLNSNATIYKGHTMQGDYGWIMRTMRGESFLGKNLKDAYETVHNLNVEHAAVVESYAS